MTLHSFDQGNPTLRSTVVADAQDALDDILDRGTAGDPTIETPPPSDEGEAGSPEGETSPNNAAITRPIAGRFSPSARDSAEAFYAAMDQRSLTPILDNWIAIGGLALGIGLGAWVFSQVDSPVLGAIAAALSVSAIDAATQMAQERY